MSRRNKKNKNKLNRGSSAQQKQALFCSNKESIELLRNPNSNKTRESIFSRFLCWLKEKQIASKIFIVCFAMAIFSYAYFNVEAANRNVLTYIGLMLTMLVAYVEILTIRDHLWVIEGSMPESRKWRTLLFNPSSMRKQKFRKMIVLLFALIIFVIAYKEKSFPGARNSLAFMGLILMITMVYYEILTIRDEIMSLTRSMQQFVVEKKLIGENND